MIICLNLTGGVNLNLSPHSSSVHDYLHSLIESVGISTRSLVTQRAVNAVAVFAVMCFVTPCSLFKEGGCVRRFRTEDI